MKKQRTNSLAALALAQQWIEQCSTDTTQRWCGHCGVHQNVHQKEVDETCVYVCDVCGNVIDESDTPF